jgi:hypothetical protein
MGNTIQGAIFKRMSPKISVHVWRYPHANMEMTESQQKFYLTQKI